MSGDGGLSLGLLAAFLWVNFLGGGARGWGKPGGISEGRPGGGGGKCAMPCCCSVSLFFWSNFNEAARGMLDGGGGTEVRPILFTVSWFKRIKDCFLDSVGLAAGVEVGLEVGLFRCFVRGEGPGGGGGCALDEDETGGASCGRVVGVFEGVEGVGGVGGVGGLGGGEDIDIPGGRLCTGGDGGLGEMDMPGGRDVMVALGGNARGGGALGGLESGLEGGLEGGLNGGEGGGRCAWFV